MQVLNVHGAVALASLQLHVLNVHGAVACAEMCMEQCGMC